MSSQQRLIDVGDVPVAEEAKSARENRHRKAGERMRQFLRFALDTGNPLRVIGAHGIGKTSWLKAQLAEKGVEVIYFSLATTAPEDFLGVVPEMSESGEASRLRIHLLSRLMSDKPKVIICDELSRAAPQVYAQVMELVNSGMLGGVEIPNLLAVIALDNPEGGAYFVGDLDPAQARRFVTVTVTAADLPWVDALRKKFSDSFSDATFDKLEEFFYSLDAKVALDVPPRVIEHMLALAADGLPIDWALPIEGRKCLQLWDQADNNVTDDVLFGLARILQAEVSADASELGAPVEDKVAKALRFCIDNGYNLHLVGDYGIGKTSLVRRLQDPDNPVYPGGIDVVIFDATQMTPENLGVPVPVRVIRDGAEVAVLDFLIYDQFLRERPYILVVDELKRATTRTKNALMEIIQERTLHGTPLGGLRAVVALDNPSGNAFSALPTDDSSAASAAGFTYSVGDLDPAQQTRFAVNLHVTASDTGWADYLRSQYGEVAEPFIAFWNEDLTDAERVMFSPANVEDAIQLYQTIQSQDGDGPLTLRDLDVTVPFVHGKRLPVSLHALRQRLQSRDTVSFSKIAADPESWFAKLESADERVRLEANLAVQTVLQRAERALLKEHSDLVQDLVNRLSRQMIMSLLRSEQDTVAFWAPICKAAKKWQKQHGWDSHLGVPPSALKSAS